MNADGNAQTRLTHNDAGDNLPTWSADWKKIAFQSYRDGNSEIYVMNYDGSNQLRLTDNPSLAWYGATTMMNVSASTPLGNARRAGI